MATITIKDLPDSLELDREAMRAITGGARLSGGGSPAARPPLRAFRVSGYPTGFAAYALPQAATPATLGKRIR